jgi:hypothetical protein
MNRAFDLLEKHKGTRLDLATIPAEESHLASRRQFITMSATRYRKRFDSISYGSGIRSCAGSRGR